PHLDGRRRTSPVAAGCTAPRAYVLRRGRSARSVCAAEPELGARAPSGPLRGRSRASRGRSGSSGGFAGTAGRLSLAAGSFELAADAGSLELAPSERPSSARRSGFDILDIEVSMQDSSPAVRRHADAASRGRGVTNPHRRSAREHATNRATPRLRGVWVGVQRVMPIEDAGTCADFHFTHWRAAVQRCFAARARSRRDYTRPMSSRVAGRRLRVAATLVAALAPAGCVERISRKVSPDYGTVDKQAAFLKVHMRN